MFCWVHGVVAALNNKGGFLDLPPDAVASLIAEGKAQHAASPFKNPDAGVETTWHGSQAIVRENIPIFVVAPYINGVGQVGTELTCDPGRWVAYPAPIVTYQWIDNGAPIPGATTSYYTPVVGDVFHIISCDVTLTNTAGAKTEPSSNTKFINSAPPRVAGEDAPVAPVKKAKSK